MFGIDLDDLANTIRSGIANATGAFSTKSMPNPPSSWPSTPVDWMSSLGPLANMSSSPRLDPMMPSGFNSGFGSIGSATGPMKLGPSTIRSSLTALPDMESSRARYAKQITAKPFTSSAISSEGFAFPVQGYQGKVDPHWGENLGGTDIFAPQGTPVVAARGGRVVNAGTNAIGGNFVTIQGDDGNQYYYAHMDRRPPVQPGQTVKAGAFLGGVGTTGNAAGTPPHLHIGIGPNITTGTGPTGGTGGNFNAIELLTRVLSGAGQASTSNDPRRAEALALAREMFGQQGEQVLNTTFEVENGWGGLIGDRNLNPAGSHGPLQFYGGGGQLNEFARQHGMSTDQAGQYVRANPVEAVRWALNSYYGDTLRQGMDMGLRGADLAEYVQMEGQRSDRNLTAGKALDAYRRLYG